MNFIYKVAVAKHLGLTALRLMDTAIIPLNTTQYALELDDYLDKYVFHQYRSGLTSQRNCRVEALAAANVQGIDFSKLRSSIKRLQNASLHLDEKRHETEVARKSHLMQLDVHGYTTMSWVRRWKDALVSFLSWNEPVSPEALLATQLSTINKKLRSFEQGFISEEGIKDREWYRHLGVAPGKWLGL
jgi:N-acetylated-alpha-linked acidic dipeptidase